MELRFIVFIQYCMFDIIAFVAMTFFRRNIAKYTERKPYLKAFLLSVDFSIALAFSDMAYAFREYGIVQAQDWVWYIFEGIYTICSILSAYCWVLSAETLKRSRLISHKPYRYAFSASMYIIMALAVTNPFHHMVFKIENGVYTREFLTIVFTTVVVLAVLTSGITSLIKSFSKDRYYDRQTYRVLFYYSAALLISSGMQLVFGSIIPFRPILVACVFFFAQDKIMKSNIFIDKISQINNRLSIEQYLITQIQGKKENFYLAILDLDNFKEVNDRYGHAAGDQAIAVMGKALKKTAVPGMMIGRYGGDEFIFAGKFENEEAVEAVIADLRDNLDKLIAKHGLSFSFSFSIGYARLTPETDSITGLYMLADRELYKLKEGREENNAPRRRRTDAEEV